MGTIEFANAMLNIEIVAQLHSPCYRHQVRPFPKFANKYFI
jgi:hypothetical protein